MNKKALFVLLIALLFPLTAFSYEVSTHAALTREAFNRPELQMSSILTRLGVSSYGGNLGDIYLDMSQNGTVTARLNNPGSGGITGDAGFTSKKFDDAKYWLSEPEKIALKIESPAGWMMVGSIREDDVAYSFFTGENPPQDDPSGNINRVFNHFYDPYHGKSLILGNKAADWAIDGKDLFGQQRNHFSIKDAREAMFRAATLRVLRGGRLEELSAPTAPDGSSLTKENHRKAYWATVFKSLGHALHLLHDMAQPQHTRIDHHAGQTCAGSLCLTGNNSFYENYLEARVAGKPSFVLPEYVYRNEPNPTPGEDGSILISPTEPSYGNYPLPRFNGYYNYYRSEGTRETSYSGTGLASYSNMNFYSAGTNVEIRCAPDDPQSANQFPKPPRCSEQLDADPKTEIEEILARNVVDASGQQIRITPAIENAKLTLYNYPVVDNLNPATNTTARVTSYSVFNQFLESRGLGKAFSLNHYNYNAQADLLLPRAVSYSAGLIDYFFRGRLEITAPREGIYGLIDHGQFAPPNHEIDTLRGFRGFDKIKLNLKNTTPAVEGSPQHMEGGILVAVLKFYRNPHYTTNLDGELIEGSSTREQFLATRTKEEEIVVSKPIQLTSLAFDEDIELSFDFSDAGLPVNAWPEVRLVVVYRGKLGDEEDAVIVSEKQISHPKYSSYANSYDIISMPGGVCYNTEQVKANEHLWDQLPSGCKGPGRTLIGACEERAFSLSLALGRGNSRLVEMRWDNDIVTIPRFVRIAVLRDRDYISGPNDLQFLVSRQTGSGAHQSSFIHYFADTVSSWARVGKSRGVGFNYLIEFVSLPFSSSSSTDCRSYAEGAPRLLEGDHERYPVPATSITGW
jgi:hypothetical protein